MSGKITDFRVKKRSKEITIVLTSKNSFDELVKTFYISGYVFNFINFIDNKNNKAEETVVTVTVKRKNKTFEPLIKKLNNDDNIEKIYINDKFVVINENDIRELD